MADIGEKTIGQLIDELITASIKCFIGQDELAVAETHKERSKLAAKIQAANSKRNLLIIALDKRFGYGDVTNLEKTYDPES